MTHDSIYPNDWLRIARKDWIRISKMLEVMDTEDAAFHLQQSLEKYLKAFLIEKGWKLKKTHEIEELLDEAIKHNSNLETFYPLCERVSNYYMIDRYPHISTYELTSEDLKKDMNEARDLIKLLFPKEEASIHKI
jgi:HEPN domain-containing protein